MAGVVFPPEPPEAQPPAGVRLDDVYEYRSAVEITYIDDVEDDEDEGLEVGPVPEPSIVG